AVRRDDVVAGVAQLDQPQQVLDLAALAPPLRHDPDEPEEDEEGDEDDERDYGHGISCETGPSRDSASCLKSASRPASIASRAPAVRRSRKRRLWSVSRRGPRISCCVTRCRMYARENRVQAGQSQPSSSGA